METQSHTTKSPEQTGHTPGPWTHDEPDYHWGAAQIIAKGDSPDPNCKRSSTRKRQGAQRQRPPQVDIDVCDLIRAAISKAEGKVS